MLWYIVYQYILYYKIHVKLHKQNYVGKFLYKFLTVQIWENWLQLVKNSIYLTMLIQFLILNVFFWNCCWESPVLLDSFEWARRVIRQVGNKCNRVKNIYANDVIEKYIYDKLSGIEKNKGHPIGNRHYYTV